ncbi:hypothetical protein [Candidatus Poriferisodalis sp.]|uniref:hypothetical protein n=1 Tax=Candidatus Poriferisodalis sp. TaxID=3101277 RepID=UPI003B020AF2
MIGDVRLRDPSVAFICAFLGITALLVPLTAFSSPYEGIGPDDVVWTCAKPLTSLAAPEVDIDEIRTSVAAARTESVTTGERYVPPTSRHPLCRGLARTQVVLGLLALAAAVWRGRRWWRSTADKRAEKRFQRLHESVDGRKETTSIFR